MRRIGTPTCGGVRLGCEGEPPRRGGKGKHQEGRVRPGTRPELERQVGRGGRRREGARTWTRLGGTGATPEGRAPPPPGTRPEFGRREEWGDAGRIWCGWRRGGEEVRTWQGGRKGGTRSKRAASDEEIRNGEAPWRRTKKHAAGEGRLATKEAVHRSKGPLQ
jgi:hypothetical protein